MSLLRQTLREKDGGHASHQRKSRQQRRDACALTKHSRVAHCGTSNHSMASPSRIIPSSSSLSSLLSPQPGSRTKAIRPRALKAGSCRSQGPLYGRTRRAFSRKLNAPQQPPSALLYFVSAPAAVAGWTHAQVFIMLLDWLTRTVPLARPARTCKHDEKQIWVDPHDKDAGMQERSEGSYWSIILKAGSNPTLVKGGT